MEMMIFDNMAQNIKIQKNAKLPKYKNTKLTILFQVPACSLAASSHLARLLHPRRPLLPRPPHLLLPQHVQVSCQLDQLNRESKYSHFLFADLWQRLCSSRVWGVGSLPPLTSLSSRWKPGQTRPTPPSRWTASTPQLPRLGGGWSDIRVERILQIKAMDKI